MMEDEDWENWESRYYIGETDETFENVEGNKHFISMIFEGMWHIGTQIEIDAIGKEKSKNIKKHKQNVKEAFESLLLKLVLSDDYEGEDDSIPYREDDAEASAKEEIERLMKTYALISHYFQYSYAEGIWE